MLDLGLTTLHRPEKTTSPTADEQPAEVLGWAFDYDSFLFTRPRNDKRTGQVAFSFDDPLCEHLYDVYHSAVTDTDVQISTLYEVMLFARWRDVAQIWAPVTDMQWNSAERKVTISAVDVARLIAHQIHHGDDAFPENEADRWVPPTSDGIATVLQAADMTVDQLADGTPDHGINAPAAGVEGSDPTLRVPIALDDGVWDKTTEIIGYEGAVDLDLPPRDVEDSSAFPYYADMVCYPAQGTDRSATVQFQAKFGRCNAEGLDWNPGAGTYMTHAIVRNQRNTRRVIAANLDARRRTGAYVHQENTPSAADDDTLRARSSALVHAYSVPVDAHTLTIGDDPLDQAASHIFHYPDDFDLADTIDAEIRDGYYRKRVIGQVNEIRLRQNEGSGVTKEEADLVPELVDIGDVTTESS